MTDADDALSPDAAAATALGLDGFGAVDPDEAPRARSQRAVVAAAVVVVVALAVGLLVWQPWSSDDAAAPITTDGAAPLSAELIIDLDGVRLVRSLQSSGGADATERAQQGFVFAAPNADLEKGPYLAFLVQPIGGSEPDPPDSDTVDIDGATATVEDNGDTVELYWEGEPGIRYGVASAGLPRARAIEFAQAVSFDGGVTTVDNDDVLAGLEPAGDVATLFAVIGVTQPLFSFDPTAVSQEYESEQGDTITLASAEITGEFAALAGLILDDERAVEVDGSPVVLGTLGSSFGGDEPGLRVVMTLRSGRLIAVTGAIDDDGLLALLAAVRSATDDEWAVVLRVVEDPMDDFLSSDGGGGETVEVTDNKAPRETTAGLPGNTEP